MSFLYTSLIITGTRGVSAGNPSNVAADIEAKLILNFLPRGTKIASIVYNPLAGGFSVVENYDVTYDCPLFNTSADIEPIFLTQPIRDPSGSFYFTTYITDIVFNWRGSPTTSPTQLTLPIGNSQPVMSNYSSNNSKTAFNGGFGNVGDAYVDWLDSSSGNISSACVHEMIDYHGFVDSYKYCKKCGKKEGEEGV